MNIALLDHQHERPTPDLAAIYLAAVRDDIKHMDAEERQARLRKLLVRTVAASIRYSEIIERGEFGIPADVSWDYAGVIKGLGELIAQEAS